ncbi:hypothetical protein IC235_17885 [Hymenobacter sp. BT664]|uniref:DUF1440 domain-containing protein n=1 Tax=Hymenobacter montanus TaxID=2771359 RepID=A0A927GL27_9BACT|nr:hypothetical protein [Hymenobacter montanus]MBD2769764.1 hypothetical protein [Hymenobacter montanus]
METILPTSRPNRRPWAWSAGATGLLAGTLDITAACLQFVVVTHKSPANVLRFVASGLFGQAALTGGAGMALVGLGLHYLIAIVFAVVFYWLYSRLPLLWKLPSAVPGVIYGEVVGLIMNWVVVPSSHVPRQPYNPASGPMSLSIVLCIGLPIAVRAARYYSPDRLRPAGPS